MHSLMDVNLLTVVIAGAIAWLLGALWYSPVLFGKQWQRLTGVTMQTAKNVGTSYAVTYLGFLLLSWAMAVINSQGGIVGLDGGLKTAGLVYVFIIAPLMLSQTMFGDQNLRRFLIDAGYRLVATVLIGVILVVWP